MQNRRLSPAFPAAGETPISDLNITPLIDVMLVLLIMFILTIPMATHKVPLELPQGGETRAEPVIHRLEIGANGGIRLDDAAIADAQLAARLAAIAAEPTAELHLSTEGEARYDRFDHVLAAIRRAGIERLGMVGNEKFVEFLR
jgi:biopolymer transport protein ExbD